MVVLCAFKCGIYNKHNRYWNTRAKQRYFIEWWYHDSWLSGNMAVWYVYIYIFGLELPDHVPWEIWGCLRDCRLDSLRACHITVNRAERDFRRKQPKVFDLTHTRTMRLRDIRRLYSLVYCKSPDPTSCDQQLLIYQDSRSGNTKTIVWLTNDISCMSIQCHTLKWFKYNI